GRAGGLSPRASRGLRRQGAPHTRAPDGDRASPARESRRPLARGAAACAGRAARGDRRLRPAAGAAAPAVVVESPAMASRRADNLPRRFAKIYTAAVTDVLDEMGLLRQIRGAVIDGSTRDAASIARVRFPTFVRYRSPQDSVPRWRVTDWGQPLTLGGVRVSLGDIVVGDLDGVVVVPRRVAHEVLQRCERLVGTENKVRTAVRRGMTPLA